MKALELLLKLKCFKIAQLADVYTTERQEEDILFIEKALEPNIERIHAPRKKHSPAGK